MIMIMMMAIVSNVSKFDQGHVKLAISKIIMLAIEQMIMIINHAIQGHVQLAISKMIMIMVLLKMIINHPKLIRVT